MFSNTARNTGVMVFAGAGISMLPPSSLPNWYQFNEAVLTALADEVSSYTRLNIAEWILSGLVERRNKTPYFAPDYMADIIAEEVGMDYFKVVQALDAQETNACHQTIAALAKAGIVHAIITTNFDRLLERAFDELHMPYEVYATGEQFAILKNRLEASSASDPLDSNNIPIIKIHGTVDDINSMVDTMSQRLIGRPKDLQDALEHMYAKHHVLFLGFSGADLDYDPDYLGLRSAAHNNQGFTFLNRSGSEARASIKELRDAWGDEARIVDGVLPDWLIQRANELSVNVELPSKPSTSIDRLTDVKKHASKWAKTMDPLQNVNILSSLLRASGDDTMAGRLFWGVWKHYRQPKDSERLSYKRFNHLMGQYLLAYGFHIGSIRPETSIRFVSEDMPPELDRDMLDNAFQYLARAFDMGLSLAAIDLAVCFALLGNSKQSIDLIHKCLDAAIEAKDQLMFIDSAIAGGVIWSMAGMWTQGLEYLETAREVAITLGQEPRRAKLCIHLTRFLAWKQQFDDALQRYQEGLTIAKKLGMESIQMELQIAAGYALVQQNQATEAIELILPACDYFQSVGRLSLLTRAALDLTRAAMFASDQEALNKAMEILVEYEAGYEPLKYMEFIELGLQHDNLEFARNNLQNLKEAADKYDHEWSKLLIPEFEQEIARRE